MRWVRPPKDHRQPEEFLPPHNNEVGLVILDDEQRLWESSLRLGGGTPQWCQVSDPDRAIWLLETARVR